MSGTIVYAKTFTPSEKELHQCPHILLPLPHTWYQQNVVLTRSLRNLKEEMGTFIHVSAMDSTGGAIKNEDIIEDMVFSIDNMNRKISSLKRLELGKHSIDLGKSEVSITHTCLKFLTENRMSLLKI